MTVLVDHLAQAYSNMSREAVAGHAIKMARAIEQQDNVLILLRRSVRQVEEQQSTAHQWLIEAAKTIRQIHTLFQSGRKREARKLLQSTASTLSPLADLQPFPAIPEEGLMTAIERYPDLFSGDDTK